LVQVPRETSRISIPAESEQAMIVRQFVRLACHRYGCDAASDNILQVTDELVANAVAHGSPEPGATVDVGILPTPRGVRIEVHDHVHAAPNSDLGTKADHDQHGLQIVAYIASEGGVLDDAEGKVVWAEVAASILPAHA
jgi:anti-sigma regulatory factor (Ser/Thr protein kinase)